MKAYLIVTAIFLGLVAAAVAVLLSTRTAQEWQIQAAAEHAGWMK